jgi:2-haloacid dehalogenase
MTTPQQSASADNWPIPAEPRVLVFDVNETLIDFESMTPLFERVLGDGRAMREWLGHLIMYSMTATLSGLYVDYFTLGQGLLKMVGDIHGVTVTDDDAALIKKGMQTMPAHLDVVKGLTLLRDKGFRLITLTNSPHTPGGPTPLEHAGLKEFFDIQYTIETCRAYKPSAAVYHYVAQEEGVPPSSCMMVAACPDCPNPTSLSPIWKHWDANCPAPPRFNHPPGTPQIPHTARLCHRSAPRDGLDDRINSSPNR